MKMNRLVLALVVTPAIFFYFFGLIIPNIIASQILGNFGLSYFGAFVFNAGPAFLGWLSFCGFTFFLLKTRANRLWYQGIPLWCTIAVAAFSLSLSMFVHISGGIPLYEDPGYVNQLAWTTALLLLSPCSALFFWSQKTVTSDARWLVIFALAISILSVICIYGTLFPVQNAAGEIRSDHSLYELWYWLYLMLGMPANGALFFALASRYRSLRIGIAEAEVENKPVMS